MGKKVLSKWNHFHIPYAWTPADRKVQELLAKITKDGHERKGSFALQQLMDAFPSRDFLGDMLHSGLLDPGMTWSDAESCAPLTDESARARVVRALLERLSNNMNDRLSKFRASNISNRGGVLYYTDRLDRCIVYDYSFPHATGKSVEVTALVDIREPKYLFDLSTALEDADDSHRSALKNALVYGHKIVAHRNTLVHVDRRHDDGVAGPFIDTLVLNEMLHKYLFEHIASGEVHDIKSVAEIGSGNGMLITSCAQNIPSLTKVVALDAHMNSVIATHRNYNRNDPQTINANATLTFICSLYDKSLLRDFDLIICNPPYVPVHENFLERFAFSPTATTQLMKQVILDAEDTLSPSGFLIMVFSHLSRKDFDSAVNQANLDSVHLGPKDGFKVRFDLDEVFKQPDWLKFLLDERDLEEDHNLYFHKLLCVAVHRKREDGFTDSTGFLAACESINKMFSPEQKG